MTPEMDYATCSVCGEGIDITAMYVHAEPGGGMNVGPSKKLHHPGCHETCLFCRADRSGSGAGTAAVHAARMEELGAMGSPFGPVDMSNPVNAEIVKDLLERRKEALEKGPRIDYATVRDVDLTSAFVEGVQDNPAIPSVALPVPPVLLTEEEQKAIDNEIAEGEIE